MGCEKSSPKVGLIATMSLDTTWPEDFVRYVEGCLVKARETLNKIGMEVLDCGRIARTYYEMTSQGKELRAKGVEVLVIYVGTWTYSSTAVAAAFECNVPVIVWADSSLGRFGIVGGAIVKGALDEVGIYNTLIYGGFNDEQLFTELKTLCLSASAVTRLRGLIYGVGGSRSMGMYTAVIDANEWRKKFGIEVDGFEQIEVVERARAMPDEKAKDFLEWMKKEFGKIEPKDEVMIAQIKLYLALKEVINEKRYDFIAVKCLPEMPSYYTTFCVAHALLNDCSDASGKKESFVCACESDSNGALTMQILKHLSGGPVLFADVLHIDVDEKIARLSNCGSHPTELAKERKEVHWLTEGLREFPWKVGGACPQFVAKPGKVTLARLSRVDGRYVMLIATGNSVELPREKLKETNWHHPHVFVKLDCSIEEFIKSLRSNHIHLVYGDYMEHLKIVCGILGIEPILPQ